MSRLPYATKGAFIDPGELYNRGTTSGWNPIYGGQQGYAPVVAEFVSNQAHKNSPLICVLLEAPGFLQYMDKSNRLVETLKYIMEVQSLTISGFSETLNVDVDQRAVGGAGAQQQEVVNVTRDQPTPSHTFVDKYGRPIQKFLEFWIEYGLMSAESKFPLAPLLANGKIKDMGPDMYSMSCLYFEPNITMTGINRAWLCVNMFPLSSGSSDAGRDLQQSSNILDLDIQFTALAQQGVGVQRLALGILEKYNKTNADNYMRESAYVGIDGDVSATGDSAYKESIERVTKESVQRFNFK